MKKSDNVLIVRPNNPSKKNDLIADLLLTALYYQYCSIAFMESGETPTEIKLKAFDFAAQLLGSGVDNNIISTVASYLHAKGYSFPAFEEDVEQVKTN